MKSLFSFDYLEEFFAFAVSQGYSFRTVKDFFGNADSIVSKTIVLRIDVDFDPLRAKNLADILDRFNAKGTFFFRLHAKYNVFSFPVMNIIRELIQNKHELGIHTELVDMEKICKCNPEDLLRKSISIYECMFDTKIYGTASHGDHTGFNNLEFWNNRNPKEFNLLYEAYNSELFARGYYVSDSLVSRWKKYFKGKIDETGASDPLALIQEKNPGFVCLLIHPDSFFTNHYHENIKY